MPADDREIRRRDHGPLPRGLRPTIRTFPKSSRHIGKMNTASVSRFRSSWLNSRIVHTVRSDVAEEGALLHRYRPKSGSAWRSSSAFGPSRCRTRSTSAWRFLLAGRFAGLRLSLGGGTSLDSSHRARVSTSRGRSRLPSSMLARAWASWRRTSLCLIFRTCRGGPLTGYAALSRAVVEGGEEGGAAVLQGHPRPAPARTTPKDWPAGR